VANQQPQQTSQQQSSVDTLTKSIHAHWGRLTILCLAVLCYAVLGKVSPVSLTQLACFTLTLLGPVACKISWQTLVAMN